MRLLLVAAALVLAAGPLLGDSGNPRAVGRYFALGFDSRRTLNLREDGTFLMVLHFRGEDLAQRKVEERGTWSQKDDVVTLHPDSGKEYDASIWYSRLLLRTDGARRRLLVGVRGAWGYNQRGFEEGESPEANQ